MPGLPTDEPPPIHSSLREWTFSLAAGGVVLLFCAALLVLDPGYFWTDDYQIANLPGMIDGARAWREGHLPLLSRSSWRGGALAGEYANGVFAPLPILCVLTATGLNLSLPSTAALVSAVHLALLSSGAFRLARGRGLSVEIAFLIAWISSLNGFIFFWGGCIWIPCLVSFAWVPWFWWALERSRDDQYGWTRFILPGVFLALVIVSGWHFTVVMAGMLTIWLLMRTWCERRRFWSVWPLPAVWSVGLALSAPSWMMLLEFLPSTARQRGPSEWFSPSWMVSLDSLPGLVFPHVTSSTWVFQYWKPHLPLELFGGLVPVVILAAALLCRGPSSFRGSSWECGLALFMLFVVTSPSVGTFSYSFRWLPLFFLVLALLSGQVLTVLRTSPTTGESSPSSAVGPNLGLWCFALIFLVSCRAVLLFPAISRLTANWSLGFFTCSICWLWSERYASTSFARRYMPCAVVFATSWMTYSSCACFSEVPRWEMGEKIRWTQPLDPTIRYVSLYTWEDMFQGDAARAVAPWKGMGAELYMGNTAMYSGLDFVNGYSSLKPAGIEEILPFRVHGYLDAEDAEHFLTNATEPRGLLQLLAVDGLVVAERFAEYRPRLKANGWWEAAKVEGGIVFQRDGAPSPRVRSVERVNVVANRAEAKRRIMAQAGGLVPLLLLGSPESAEHQTVSFATAQLSGVEESRNWAAVDVDSPSEGTALIVFSRPWYPGYRASLNGNALPVEVANLMLPAVRLPPGAKGRVVLEYWPRSLVIGGWVAAAAGLFIGVVFVVSMVRKPRDGRPWAFLHRFR